MFRLDFKASPEYGNPDTGKINYVDGHYVYDVNEFSVDSDSIYDGSLVEKWQDINTLSFKVFRESLTGATQDEKDSKWRDLAAQRTSVRLWSKVKQKYVFEGRISSAVEEMDSAGRIFKAIQCESELAYLADTTVSLADIYREFGAVFEYDDNLFIGDAYDLIAAVLSIHNRNASGFAGDISKAFQPYNGNIYPNGDYPLSIMFYRPPYVPDNIDSRANYVHLDKELDVMSAWALIQWVCMRHGLSVSVKYDPDHTNTNDPLHKILFVEGIKNENREHKYVSSPKIRLRDNMTSLKVTHNFSGKGRVTRIVPLGGVGADGTRMNVQTLTQYNSITHEMVFSRAVANDELVLTYGEVDRIEIHNDLVDDGNRTSDEVIAMQKTLLARGQESAKKLNDKVTAIQVGAYDLAEAGENVDEFKVGYSYTVDNEMFSYRSGGSTVVFDKAYQLLSKTTPLISPWRASFTFGDETERPSQKNVSAQLSLKQQTYSTGTSIASRLDNAAIKLCSSESEYTNFGTHREETLYTVPQSNGETWLYKGDERIVISEGGGGGDSFTVDYASVLSSEQSVKYTTGETMSVAAQCGMTAIYGGAPSRGVCNGYRVLFNVPYADITQEDVSSYMKLYVPYEDTTSRAGWYYVFRCRLSEQTATGFIITIYWNQYTNAGVQHDSGFQRWSASYSGSLSGLTFGIAADFSTISEADSSYQAVGIYGKYSGTGHGLSGAGFVVPKVWLNGSEVALTRYSYDYFEIGNLCYIMSEAELHFDMSLNKRYEPAGGV